MAENATSRRGSRPGRSTRRLTQARGRLVLDPRFEELVVVLERPPERVVIHRRENRDVLREKRDERRRPDQPIVGSEEGSTVTTRGIYADDEKAGYVSAYDADTGAMAWRFYTVPGDPSQGPEGEALEMARKTWHGDEYYTQGGGGTVWDSMAYDPELDLLYIGTGNGSPWNRKIRSPEGGDNLFLCSIVALNPDTGRVVWFFQHLKNDQWDFDWAFERTLLSMPVSFDGITRSLAPVF